MDLPYRALVELAVCMAGRSAFEEERRLISALFVPARGVAGVHAEVAGRAEDQRWAGRAAKAP